MAKKSFATILATFIGICLMLVWAYYEYTDKPLFDLKKPYYVWIILLLGIYGIISFINSLVTKKVYIPRGKGTITKKENTSAYWWNVVATGIAGLFLLIYAIVILVS